jgi:hypothetical protein
LFASLNIVRSIIDKLGRERISKLKIVGNEEVEKSLYGQLVHHKGILSGTNEELAKEAMKAGKPLSWADCHLFCNIYFFTADDWILKWSTTAFCSVSAQKQKIAEEVASMLKLSVSLDSSSSERLIQ